MYLKNIINILIEGYVIYQISWKKLSVCCYEMKSKKNTLIIYYIYINKNIFRYFIRYKEDCFLNISILLKNRYYSSMKEREVCTYFMVYVKTFATHQAYEDAKKLNNIGISNRVKTTKECVENCDTGTQNDRGSLIHVDDDR